MLPSSWPTPNRPVPTTGANTAADTGMMPENSAVLSGPNSSRPRYQTTTATGRASQANAHPARASIGGNARRPWMTRPTIAASAEAKKVAYVVVTVGPRSSSTPTDARMKAA